jgi:hypothetical protein
LEIYVKAAEAQSFKISEFQGASKEYAETPQP